MIQFFQTGMGQAFYERRVPEIATALNNIATQLEESNRLKERELILKEEELTFREKQMNKQAPDYTI